MVVLKTQKPFTGNIVLVAFPGLGFVGTIAGRYIAEKLNLNWTGYLFDDRLPPMGKVRDGKLLYPINIYSGESISLVLAETAISPDLVWDVSRAIITKARKDGAKYVIAISGVLMPDNEGVFGIPSNTTARKLMEKFGIKEIENGVITGVSAAILLHSREMGVPSILLLGPASNQQDFNAAITTIRALSSIIGRDIPTEELLELAHKYEHEMKMLQQKLGQSTSTPMYG